MNLICTFAAKIFVRSANLVEIDIKKFQNVKATYRCKCPRCALYPTIAKLATFLTEMSTGSLILYYDEYIIFLLAKAYGCRICCRNNFFRIPIRILVRYLLTLPNILGHGNHILYLENCSHPKIFPSNDFIYKEKDNFN